MLFVAVFGFLLASFTARNSSLWLHLAAGREIARAAQVSATSAANSAGLAFKSGWLFDLLCYAVYSLVGGSALVLLNALLAAGIAVILLRLCRIGPGWRLPAVCTGLALLAISNHLQLQPAMLSLLFLALILWITEAENERMKEDRRTKKPAGPFAAFPFAAMLPPWRLIGLFLVWVNVDSWFVLGLGTLAFIWLGRVLDAAQQKNVSSIASSSLIPHPSSLILIPHPSSFILGFVLLAAVCLLNPSGLHAFSLPWETQWFGLAGMSGQSIPLRPLPTPFEKGYLANLGQTPAGLSYYALLGLGLFSFILNLPRWHWQRFLPWLGLGLLSAFQARTVPFFALVAAPVLARNLEEFFARHSESERRQGRLWGGANLALGALTALLSLTFLAFASAGRLQAPPIEQRRWAVEPSSSLEQGAATVRSWYHQGLLGSNARGLHLSPATASVFAWFCPEENPLFDDGLAAPFMGLEAPNDWYARMRSAGVNHVIVYDTSRGRLLAILYRLLSDPEIWPVLYMEGDLAIFGWRDPAKGAEPFRVAKLDLNRQAFRPAADKRAPRQASVEPEQRPWWRTFWKPAPPRTIDRDEATLHLLHAEALKRLAPIQHKTAWEACQSAAIVAAAGGWIPQPGGVTCPLLDAHVRLAVLQPPPLDEQAFAQKTDSPLVELAMACQIGFLGERDDTPPAVLYLAIRAARRALAHNPEDADASLVLGQSYLRLLNDTRERAWSTRMPELAQLRHIQASAALYRAVSLKPDLAQAHLHLASLYREMNCLDLSLEHLRTYLKLARSGSAAGDRTAVVQEQLAQNEQRASELAQLVDERVNAYTAAAGRMRVVDRALLALQNGLAGKARDILLDLDVSAFGVEGMSLELELLLRIGRPSDVLNRIGPEQMPALGASGYHSVRGRALAASGDYTPAQEELASTSADQAQGMKIRASLSVMIGQALLDGFPTKGSLFNQLCQPLPTMQFLNRAGEMAQTMRKAADLSVLRGLLFLEEGDVEEAEVAFRVALLLWKDEASAASGSSLDFGGRIIAQECLEWLK
jgi:tetratricopeptide (TPR) repeat protein